MRKLAQSVILTLITIGSAVYADDVGDPLQIYDLKRGQEVLLLKQVGSGADTQFVSVGQGKLADFTRTVVTVGQSRYMNVVGQFGLAIDRDCWIAEPQKKRKCCEEPPVCNECNGVGCNTCCPQTQLVPFGGTTNIILAGTVAPTPPCTTSCVGPVSVRQVTNIYDQTRVVVQPAPAPVFVQPDTCVNCGIPIRRRTANGYFCATTGRFVSYGEHFRRILSR